MIYYEYDKFGKDDVILIEEYPNLHYPYPHFHRNYEFVSLYEGRLDILIDDENFTLEAGQFLMVHPNQIHGFTSLGGAHARVCIFSPKIVNEFYQNTLNLLPLKTVVTFEQSVAAFINANLRPQSDKYLLKACLYAACAEIARQTDYAAGKKAHDYALIHQVITYVSQNFKSGITLKTASESLGYSYQYLSNYLHKYNLNFAGLINQHRLDYAKFLLKNSEFSITDIAFECGYNNVRTFNRNFLRAFAATPREYKKS